jgi:hypothetical protein
MEITIGEIIITILGIAILLYYMFQVYKENNRKKDLCIQEEDMDEIKDEKKDEKKDE